MKAALYKINSSFGSHTSQISDINSIVPIGDKGADPEDVVAPLLLHVLDGVQVFVLGFYVLSKLRIPRAGAGV